MSSSDQLKSLNNFHWILPEMLGKNCKAHHALQERLLCWQRRYLFGFPKVESGRGYKRVVQMLQSCVAQTQQQQQLCFWGVDHAFGVAIPPSCLRCAGWEKQYEFLQIFLGPSETLSCVSSNAQRSQSTSQF